MRTITFRGFNARKNKWLYGDLLHNRGETFIAPPGMADPLATPADFIVSPETVGQSTGLQDKDGRDIYEGDIIDWHSSPHLVEFRSGEFFANSEACDPERYGGFSLKFISFYGHRHTAKVIGNAADNAEMLKGGGQP